MVQMNGQNEDVAGMRLMDYLIQQKVLGKNMNKQGQERN